MNTIEIARKFAQLGEIKDARKAYCLFLQSAEEKKPEEEIEAASYIFFSKGDYQISFTSFVSLYNRGFFQEELMDLMMQAFYLPNVEDQKKQYGNNCKILSRYPYFFRRDFPTFEELPIQFFPFNNQGFIPFFKEENRFGSYVNFNDPVIDRYFFKDLENPILASDVYSQYHLEYLNDNVRKSEWVAKENHIYLHYTNWLVFCAYLSCLNFKKILDDKKFVFLMEDEISQYPIDFKERYGIDYTQFPVRPLGVREVNRLIWHTQLSAHNGGDFFNEIFHGHPNLLIYDSIMFNYAEEIVRKARKDVQRAHIEQAATPVARQLIRLKNPTDKDLLVAIFLSSDLSAHGLDKNSRIVPALFFQPHFHNLHYQMRVHKQTDITELYSKEAEKILKSPLFQEFKYIKTFTPLRRVTTSYAATVRFMANKGFQKQEQDEQESAKNQRIKFVSDALNERILNRSYLIDWQSRLFRDSILVRFEDGKLNPKATFTALAEFLDIPYTQSMTYCSGASGIDPESMVGNVRGFDPATVYRTYDEYANNSEREYLEYFMRDVYEAYGYDFHYYKGELVDDTWIEEKQDTFTCLDQRIADSWVEALGNLRDPQTGKKIGATEKDIALQLIKVKNNYRAKRLHVAKLLQHGLRFVNKEGQPLHMMKLLKLDPELLEQPLYH